MTIFEDPYNKRVRIDDLEGEINSISKLEIPSWTEKLIVKSKRDEKDLLRKNGFEEEGFVPGYFLGSDMFFLTRYLNPDRGKSDKVVEEIKIIESILLSERLTSAATDGEVRVAHVNDIKSLSAHYASIFPLYPTPLSDPNHIAKSMKEGTIYAVIEDNNQIVSSASAEVNWRYKNAELTDCATLPQEEGKGYMFVLLSFLEDILINRKINCLYTLARAISYGMNKVFFNLDYNYSGRLTNNCVIYSGFEDMNVWYKNVLQNDPESSTGNN